MTTSNLQKNRHNLMTLMVGCFVCLLAFSVRAALERGIFENGPLMADVWFHVTLLDAYLGFLIFYAWVAYKEQTPAGRIIWFVIIMLFGNMATALYVVLQIRKLPSNRPVSEILFHASGDHDEDSSSG